MGTPPDLSREQRTGDPRVSGIATVGWITLAGLALCVPLAALLKSPLIAGALPLALILGSGLMAMRIWSSREKLVNQKENEVLTKRISELEERLSNLEMIDSLEAHFAEKHRKPTPPGNTNMGPPPEETSS
jgi:Tfp pilus assembly protein PilN